MFKKYGSTEQIRNVIKAVTNSIRFVGLDENNKPIYNNAALPIIDYIGTVKTHGTNCGIGYDVRTEEISVQSRERAITIGSDNAGAAAFVYSNEDTFRKVFEDVMDYIPGDMDSIHIYGEWSGSNDMRKYNKRIFYIFKIMVDGYYLPHVVVKNIVKEEYNQFGIYNCYQFRTYNFTIDFNNPEYANNEIVRVVEDIEENCPVWSHFKGLSDIKVFGEGLVLTPVDTDTYNKHEYVFKAKGEKHQSSKVKVISSINIEKVESINGFVDYVLTESRLLQGIQNLNESNIDIDVKNTGAFLKWVMSDVLKEETDTLLENNLIWKDVTGKLSSAARTWYFEYINNNI